MEHVSSRELLKLLGSAHADTSGNNGAWKADA